MRLVLKRGFEASKTTVRQTTLTPSTQNSRYHKWDKKFIDENLIVQKKSNTNMFLGISIYILVHGVCVYAYMFKKLCILTTFDCNVWAIFNHHCVLLFIAYQFACIEFWPCICESWQSPRNCSRTKKAMCTMHIFNWRETEKKREKEKGRAKQMNAPMILVKYGYFAKSSAHADAFLFVDLINKTNLPKQTKATTKRTLRVKWRRKRKENNRITY